MGFTALSSILIPLMLLPAAVWLWALRFRKKKPGKKRIFPLIALVQSQPQVPLILVGLSLTLLGVGLRGSLPPESQVAFIIFPVLGIILFISGIAFAQKRDLPREISLVLHTIGKWLRITRAQAVFLLSSPLLAGVAVAASGDGLKMRAPTIALFAWGLAIAAVLLGAWPIKSKPFMVSRNTLLLAAILCVSAFLLRGINATGIPNNLTGDEASGGLSAVEFLQNRADNVLGFGWYSFPAFYFYLQSISVAILGQTTLALRITSALAGALTVSGVYLAGRSLYGQRAGLYAAIFLAGLHFHIHFSRIGLNNVWDGFWYTVVLGLLWWAWKEERREAFLLAGFSLGISQYFYVSVRLLFVLIPAWLLLAGLANRKRWRRNATSVLLMFAVALIVFLPLAANYARHFDQFMAPMQRVSLLGNWLENEKQITGLPAWQILAKQMWLSIQAYTSTNLRHWYTPEVPILRTFAAGFFVLGLVMMVLDWRKPQHWLVALWFGAFTASGGLSESTPAAQRYIGVAPAVALVVGYALSEISERLAGLWKASKRVLQALALIAVVILATSDITFYFREFTPRGEYSGTNTAVAQSLADYLLTRPDVEQVAFYGQPRMGYYSISSTAFLAPHVVGLDMNAPFGAPENPQITSNHVLFVFLPEQASNMEALLAMFSSSEVTTVYDMQANILFWVVETKS